jgi:hypothetical protein
MGKHSRSALASRREQPLSFRGWVGERGMDELAAVARSARSAYKPFGRRLVSRAELAGASDTTRLTATTMLVNAPLPRRSATSQPTMPIPLGEVSPGMRISTAAPSWRRGRRQIRQVIQ